MSDQSHFTSRRWALCAVFAFGVLLLGLAGCSSSSSSSSPQSPETPVTPPFSSGGTLAQISSDPYSIPPGQHATEVEPHVLANGSTLVAAFQVGRIVPGGATDIGWATSTDGGTTWSHGFLPGLTTGEGTGPYDAASDPEVAYDAKHGVWIIASLPISSTLQTPAVTVSRSLDGGMTWQSPVSVDTSAVSSDKNWIVCDSYSASPHYGNCYVEWDDFANGDQILMSTSTDGGLTWGPALTTADGAFGIGGQPLVQPNGTVVVPIEAFGFQTTNIAAFTSINGGASWTALVTITAIQAYTDAGGIRSGPLPSAAVDGAGTVWVVWEDCRFRAACAANDLVYSTSTDGTTWTTVTRVPIDQTSSTADYFIPGIGIDPLTSGSSAHVAIHFYYYPQSNCTKSTCQLYVGFISSANGGSTWNQPLTLAGPMQLSWLPNSQNGLMVGDYIATAFVNGVPHGVFAVAAANSGTTFNEAIYTSQGLTAMAKGRQLSSALDRPLHKLTPPIERERPEKGVPPLRRKARSSAK
ncbi:MAG TPA: sialidase family protein [Candidatus Acidoferrales bacterium]|nr:sialidase family protein [Candidatus Acidoferrales bacterium]